MKRATHTAKHGGIQEHTGKIVIGLIVLVVLFGTWRFFDTYEKITDAVYTPLPETQKDFYTAGVLLEREGKQVTRLSDGDTWEALRAVWQDLDNAKHTTVVLKEVSEDAKPELHLIETWVKAGGHIITFNQDVLGISWDGDTADEAYQDYQQDQNQLLVHLQVNTVRQRPVQSNRSDEKDIPLLHNSRTLLKLPTGEYTVIGGIGYHDTVVFDDELTNLPRFADYTAVAKADVAQIKAIFAGSHTKQTKEQEAVWQAYSEDWQNDPKRYSPDTGVLDIKWGEGRVTAMMDKSAFDNPHPSYIELETSSAEEGTNRVWRMFNEIDDISSYRGGLTTADNGYFLSHLTADRDYVYFVSRVKREQFLSMLWHNAPLIPIAILVSVLAALLMLPRQFGRRLDYETYQSRNVLHFFGSIGQYLWATDEAKQLTADNRKRLLERIWAAHPKSAYLDDEQLCQALAEQTGLDAELIYQALYQDYTNQNEFLAVSRAFAKLNRHFFRPL